MIVLECPGFLRIGGKAGKIERDAADQRPAVSFGGRREAILPQTLLDEIIDRIADGSARIRNFGNRWPCNRLICPVALIDGALGHPTADLVLLVFGQFLVRIKRRHAFRRISREDTRHNGALRGIARNNRCISVFQRLHSFVANIETHASHPRTLVRPMTAKAGIGHDGADVAIKADSFVFSGKRKGSEKQQKQNVIRGVSHAGRPPDGFAILRPRAPEAITTMLRRGSFDGNQKCGHCI